MIFRSKLFLLVVLIVTVSVYAQKKNKGKNKNPLVNPTGQCLLPTDSPQFALLCRVTNVTNALLPGLQNLTAAQVCDADCRCVMGARAGGTCGRSPYDGKTYCRCDYESKATKPIALIDLVCKTVFPIVTNALCPLKLPIVGGLINNTACVNDCICSHGYDPKQTHQCTTKNGVKGNKVQYCVCNGTKNK